MNRTGVEVQAATIEEAIQKGLSQLAVTRTAVSIDVIDEGSRGVLGIGKREAIVRLTRLDSDGKPMAAQAVPAAQQPAVEEPPAAPEATAPELVVPEPVVPEPVVPEPVVPEPVVPEPVGAKPVFKEQPPAAVSEPAEPRAAEATDEDASLQHEADVALQVVTTLLQKMQIDAQVDVAISPPDDMDQQIPIVEIHGDDLSTLIGPRGSVLNQLQFIARAMVSQQIQDRTRFVIDIGGYRSRRQEKLVDLAQRTAEKAVRYRRPIALNPMPPHERRIIHITLRNDSRVTTESKGEGDRRRVRVIPKGGSRNGGRRDDRSRNPQRHGNRR